MKNDFIIRGKEATLFVEAPPNVGYGSVEVKLGLVHGFPLFTKETDSFI